MIRAGGCRAGDGHMLQELDTLRRRCAQQEAQLSAQEQIILSLSAQVDRGGLRGDGGSGPKPPTPQTTHQEQEQTDPPRAVKEEESDAGGGEDDGGSEEVEAAAEE